MFVKLSCPNGHQTVLWDTNTEHHLYICKFCDKVLIYNGIFKIPSIIQFLIFLLIAPFIYLVGDFYK